MIRIIIAGTRTFNDFEYLENAMLHLIQNINKEKIIIISGNAKGADKLGEKFAKKYNLKLEIYPADWSIGKSAGYIRNSEMANVSNVCVCFWDNKSKGTKHMIDLAYQKGLQVRIFYY